MPLVIIMKTSSRRSGSSANDWTVDARLDQPAEEPGHVLVLALELGGEGVVVGLDQRIAGSSRRSDAARSVSSSSTGP